MFVCQRNVSFLGSELGVAGVARLDGAPVESGAIHFHPCFQVSVQTHEECMCSVRATSTLTLQRFLIKTSGGMNTADQHLLLPGDQISHDFMHLVSMSFGQGGAHGYDPG